MDNKIKLKEVLSSILEEEITEDSAPYFLASVQQTLNKFRETDDVVNLVKKIVEND